jgi:type II secretion system protein G
MKNNGGFSLIEILIVFGIIGTILAIIVGNVTSGSEAAKKKETILKISNIQAGLIRFQQDMGKLPETAEGITSLVTNPGSPKWTGPYLGGGEADLKDGWGNALEYEKTAQGTKITSQGGPDGVPLVFNNGRLSDDVASKDGAATPAPANP